MATSGSVFSQTLQDVTTAKLDELAKKRQSFEQSKANALSAARAETSELAALEALANGVKTCFSISTKNGKIVRYRTNHRRLEVDLENLDRFLYQARFDPSISSTIVQQWRDTMLEYLNIQSLKYTYADLYGRLTMEWLSTTKSAGKGQDTDAMDTSQDFEEVESRAKIESRRLWEQNVFNAIEVDAEAINSFLQELFREKGCARALREFKESLSDFATSVTNPGQINVHSLRWAISGVLNSDLLNEEKRQVLRDFLSNPSILTEIADVLDMRLTRLESWSWGGDVHLEQRRQVTGVYNIYMHEDLLQAIFLHYIGVKWSVFLKSGLRELFRASQVLQQNGKYVTESEKRVRDWYLGKLPRQPNIQTKKSLYYQAGYLVAQLMDCEIEDISMEDGEMEAEFGTAAGKKRKRTAPGAQVFMAAQAQQAVSAPAPPTLQAPVRAMRDRQTARNPTGGIAQGFMPESRGNIGYDMDEEASVDESETDIDLGSYKPQNPMQAKQRLLHLLSTDIIINTRLKGELTCFRTHYESWNPLLPHDTIKTVMNFFGFPIKWLNFFETFLKAPLRFIDDEDAAARRRQRGTPGAHVLSEVFGEMVLFSLDFAVAQQTGGEVLWRLNEDIWWWGSHETSLIAWNAVQKFNKVMKVDLDEMKTGSARFQLKDGSITAADTGKVLPKGEVRWGMLFLDPDTGRFQIDHDMVATHVEELRKQLKEKESSIFSWVQAYSTYVSVFFTSNLGRPANCFGQEHIDNMLETHKAIQESLFKSSSTGVVSVVDWLHTEIKRRFNITDIPDGYLFFPTEVGGLEVKSPFIGLLQVRDSIEKEPSKLFDEFAEAEKDAYHAAKKRFEERKPYEWHNQPRLVGNSQGQAEPEKFLSFEEYTRYRDRLNYGFDKQLVDIYDRLLRSPDVSSIEIDNESQIFVTLMRLQNQGNLEKFNSNWYSMDPYWRWVAALYGPEMTERFGGFNIVDPGLLPMGMVNLFRSGRVQWQE